MRIDSPRTLDDYLKQRDMSAPEQVLCCHPDAETPLDQALRAGNGSISLLVGPEGGWSDEELALARAGGAVAERKSVVWGRSVSVRVDFGGRRMIKKNKN